MSSITSCARYKTGELLTKGDNGGNFYTNEEIEAVVAFRDKFRIKNNLPLPTDIPRTEIGIFIMNGLPYVPVTVNGKKGNMVLDSGASGISLSI